MQTPEQRQRIEINTLEREILLALEKWETANGFTTPIIKIKALQNIVSYFIQKELENELR